MNDYELSRRSTSRSPESSASATDVQFAVGVFAGLGAMACFGSWPVITRAGTFTLDFPVLVFMRFVVPTVFFFAVIMRTGLVPRGLSIGLLVTMVVGSGLPSFLCAAGALALAPVAEVGPIIPGTPPLFVALYMLLIERQRFRRVQMAGLVFITLGVIFIVGFRFQSHTILAGHLLALAAAVLWSAHIIAFRASGLTAAESTALVSVWSVFSALPFGLPFVYDALLAELYASVTAQFVMQGLGTGIVAVLLLGITIRNVGASEASAIVAIAPVLSVVLAIPLLGEVPEWQAAVGAVAITCGAVLTNWRAPRPPPAIEHAVELRRLNPLRWQGDARSRGTDDRTF